MPLKATINPGFQTIDSGGNAILNCTITGTPLVSVQWYKNGDRLIPDDRIVYKSTSVLEIRSVAREDQGMYQCFASDFDEETQAAAQLLLGGNYCLHWMDSFFLISSR